VIAVHRFSQRPEAVALASANKRVANILAKQADQPMTINPAALQDDAEIVLAKAIQQMQGKVAPLIAEREYNQALELLAELHEIIDRFFIEIMVLAEDPEIRANRIALLQQLRCLFLDVADISLLNTN
jgi:glycyl-tRNA synthetase beta chain